MAYYRKSYWDEISDLGQVPDADLAKRLGVTRTAVGNARKRRKIPALNPTPVHDINWDAQQLGKLTDQHIADMLGCSLGLVYKARIKRNIKPAGLLYRTEEGEAAYYGEAIIDSWLHKNCIAHEFQKIIGGKRVDWFLPESNSVWEYAGMRGHLLYGRDYELNLAARIAVVQNFGFTVRVIEKHELKQFAENIDLTCIHRRSSFICEGCNRNTVAHQAKNLCGKCYKRAKARKMAIKKIAEAIKIAGGRMYLVGGAVRDSFLGKQPKDMDYIACGINASALEEIIERFGYTKLVGESFGVYKVKFHGSSQIVDIALPRTEISTGVGHDEFDIETGSHISLEQDLQRRDFTCNSIAEDVLTGDIVDPFKGREDIKSNRLKLVHTWAFMEDPLRMLRACQFAARLGFVPDQEMMLSMTRDAHLVESVSTERIAIELCKLMKAPLPSVGFRIMRDTTVLKYAWRELWDLVGLQQNPAYHAFDVFEHVIRACDAIPARGKHVVWRRNLAVSHDIGKFKRRQFKNLVDQFREDGLYEIVGENVVVTSIPWVVHTFTMEEAGQPQFLGHDVVGAEMFKEMFARMKFSSVTDEAVPGIYFPSALKMESLIRNHMFMCDCDSTPKSLRKFVKTVGQDLVFDQIRLRIADRAAKGLEARTDVREWLAFAKRIRTLSHGQKAPAAFSLKDLAVKGNDLMEKPLSMKPGPQMGKILQTLLDRVVEDPELNTRDALLALAGTLV